MKKFWAEFKAFIAKGNVIDLAVAVIIGGAFNKIVSSLVNDVIMPLVSLAVGGADVKDWKWVITPAEYDEAGKQLVAETALRYGVFIQTIIDFLIIAFTVFMIVKIFKFSREKAMQLQSTAVEKIKSKKKKKKGQVEETQEVVAETPVEAPVEAVAEVVKEEVAPVVETIENNNAEMISLLTEIRDALTKKSK